MPKNRLSAAPPELLAQILSWLDCSKQTLPPLKITTVLGYPGGSEIDLAVEKGEVICRGMTASPYFGREPFISWDKKEFVRVLLFTGDKRDERIRDVPTLREVSSQRKGPGEQSPRR